MSDVVHDSYSFSNLPLTGGGNLPEVTLAYVTRGRLAPDGRNARDVGQCYPGKVASAGQWQI